MKNSFFDIVIDKTTGGISSIKNCNDKHEMNWCANESHWGRIMVSEYYFGKKVDPNNGKNPVWGMVYDENIALKSCEGDDNRFEAEYVSEKLSVKVVREFTKSGNLAETYIIKNITNTVISLNRDNLE